MRRTLFVAIVTTVFMGLMAGTALAHVCYIDGKAEGAGSAGTGEGTVDVYVDESFNVLGVVEGHFELDEDAKVNEKNGRVIGGFITLTVTVNVWQVEELGDTNPILIDSMAMTADVLAQNTVGGGAHFAGPGDSGCDGIGMDSLESCLMEALAS